MTSAGDVFFTYCCGLATTLGSAPVIHPFNVVAAAAAKTQLTSGKAAHAVYAGLGSNNHNTLANFENGLGGHLSKELVRSVGRIIGVVYIEKDFKERFSPAVAPMALASVMGVYEVVLANPADVWKSYRATGIPTTRESLFRGSLFNYWRQFGMWAVWSSTTPHINKFLDNRFSSPTNPETTTTAPPAKFSTTKTGIFAKSFLQAVACTVVTYPLELILRTVQVRHSEYNVKGFRASLDFTARCASNPGLIAQESAYWRVTADLIKHNGIRGLGLGMTAKLLGNTMLLSNANCLGLFSAWMAEKTGRTKAKNP